MKLTLLLSAALLSLPLFNARADEFQDALKSAYEKNPRIQAQRRSLEQTNERVSQAVGNFLPSVSATYENGRQRNDFDNAGRTYSDLENKRLAVTQPLFAGGSNLFRLLSAKDQVRAGRADLMTQEQRVLLDAITAYMDVVQNESVLRLSQSNEGVLGKQLDASNSRFEVGDVTRTDVAQSQARLARSKSDVIQSQGDLDSSLANFERLIGFKPENLPLPVPSTFPALPATLEEAIEEGLKNNPTITSAKYSQEAADNDIYATAGTILPQVNLVGSMSREDGAGTRGTSTFDSDSIKVSVSIPIYQKGIEYSRVREARLIEKRLEFEKENAEEAVRESIITSWEDLQTSVASITSQQEVIKAAETALGGVRQEQQYGSRTILDVLDAEQELFISRVNLVRAERNRVVAIFNLLLVLGKMDINTLGVSTTPYDPKDHYDDVKWQLIGF